MRCLTLRDNKSSKQNFVTDGNVFATSRLIQPTGTILCNGDVIDYLLTRTIMRDMTN